MYLYNIAVQYIFMEDKRIAVKFNFAAEAASVSPVR